MKQKTGLTQTRHVMLLRSIGVLLSPVVMVIGLLACGTIVTETASYVCPTRLPPTVAPIVVGPGTPIVIPTLVPTSTPYRIFPPQDFYVGDAIFVGQIGSSVRLRFRLQSIQSRPAPPHALYVWSLEIKNLGTTAYETIPVAQAIITQIRTTSGDLEGTWSPTDKAMKAAGFLQENYEPLLPGSTRNYRLAAYGPVGSVRRIAFRLDETGANQIIWINQANPFCVGDVAD